MDMTGVTGQFPSSVRMILFTSLLNSLSERDVFFLISPSLMGKKLNLMPETGSEWPLKERDSFQHLLTVLSPLPAFR